MQPLAHPLRMWIQSGLVKVKTITLYSPKQIVIEVTTFLPLAHHPTDQKPEQPLCSYCYLLYEKAIHLMT